MNTQLNILPVLFLLAGCGGADFTGEPLFGEGTGGGATGGLTGVTGGVTGVTGGAGGAVGTGGAQAGTGGSLVGTGGDGTGGAQTGTGGQPAGTGGVLGGTGGMGTGGAIVGTGGAGTTCKPPVVTDLSPELPTTIVWDSYLSQVHAIPVDLCLRCVNSPCTTCDVSWYPVTQSTDGLTITAKATVSCAPMDMSLSACSSAPTTACTTWSAPGFYATLTLELQPKADGTGFTTVYRTLTSGSLSSYQGLGGTCQADAYSAAELANRPMEALFYVLRDDVVAAEWPCGG